jgi:hypothetical protein
LGRRGLPIKIGREREKEEGKKGETRTTYFDGLLKVV